jgi:hypothetical protein
LKLPFRFALERHGTTQTLEEFRVHRAVNCAGFTGKILPFELLVDGEPRTMQLRDSATVSHAHAYVACCEAGLGFIQLPRYHVDRQLADGSLREVLASIGRRRRRCRCRCRCCTASSSVVISGACVRRLGGGPNDICPLTLSFCAWSPVPWDRVAAGTYA